MGGPPMGSCTHEHRPNRYQPERSDRKRCALADVGRVRPTLAEYHKTTGEPPVPHLLTLPSPVHRGEGSAHPLYFAAIPIVASCGPVTTAR